MAVPACPVGVAAGPEAASAGRGPVLCMKGVLKAGIEPGSIPYGIPGSGGGRGIGSGGTRAKLCPYISGPCCLLEMGLLLSLPVVPPMNIMSSLDGSRVQ